MTSWSWDWPPSKGLGCASEEQELGWPLLGVARARGIRGVWLQDEEVLRDPGDWVQTKHRPQLGWRAPGMEEHSRGAGGSAHASLHQAPQQP